MAPPVQNVQPFEDRPKGGWNDTPAVRPKQQVSKWLCYRLFAIAKKYSTDLSPSYGRYCTRAMLTVYSLPSL